MIQKELEFNRYPNRPGFKKRDTSRAAARDAEYYAPTLRDQCLEKLMGIAALTADEIAEGLGRSILSVRPRVAELAKMGFIRDTGLRRRNSSGKMAIVWEKARYINTEGGAA